jgi:glycerophosphoryl diester phosphodiesterase
MKAPLYKSFRESFDKDFCSAVTNVVSAPVTVLELNEASDIELLSSDSAPQNVILLVDAKLNVFTKQGKPVSDLYSVLSLCKRTLPIFYITTEKAADNLSDFLYENRIADAMLCTVYENRDLLCYAYAKMPMLRCMIDARGASLPEDISELPSILVSSNATSVILDADTCDRLSVHRLQKRFIHVICDDEKGELETVTKGVNGIITAYPEKYYSLYEKFPENSFLKIHKLYAHKGFQNNGTYSENTISGVYAAGEYHFDGAEIDVKLTGDSVPIVMHNLNTRGLFDCEEMITEETDFDKMKDLRRIGYPDEGIDLFSDLMFKMKEMPATPVVIEFKPSAKYYRVEEMIELSKPILSDERAQKNCVAIMGSQLCGLDYVHRELPFLPLGHCEGGKQIPPPPTKRSEAEERLYRIASITKGTASAYNPEDVNINRLFNEYAKIRGLCVFPWSRSWTLAPSLWENNGPVCDNTYLSGYDGWTTDHGEMYLDYPIMLKSNDGFGTEYNAGEEFDPLCVAIHRDGSEEECPCGIFDPSGCIKQNADGRYFCEAAGTYKVLLTKELTLHFGDRYRIFSSPTVITVK